jgi:aminopeptidase N
LIVNTFLYRICLRMLILPLSIIGVCINAQVDYSAIMKAYDVKFYFFNLSVSNRSTNISGNVTIQLVINDHSIDSLVLELTDAALVDSVHVDSLKIPFAHSGDYLRFSAAEIDKEADHHEISVFYSISTPQPDANRGVSTEVTPEGRSYTWTLSEPFYAKNWFPCKQELTDKVDSAYLFFTVDDSLKVGSNGLLQNIVSLNDGKLRYEWKTRYPMVYYLPSFAVGDYLDYSFTAVIEGNEEVLVQNYIYNDSSFLNQVKADVDITADLITLFSQKMGKYPFLQEKYGHCIAPLGGGMEHQTMTTLGSFEFGLVAHELAHQWFGDNVTCSNWQDIWINEGFASYAEYIALEGLKSYAECNSWLVDASSLVMSQPDGSVAVPESELTNDNRIFNYRLTYRKGAYIIHMIRHELNNDDLFFRALETFQEQFTDSIASANDFRYTLEQLSGQRFENFFNQWYYGEGYPILNFSWKQKNDSLIINVEQQVSAPSVTAIFEIPIDIRVFYLGGDTLIRIFQHLPSQTFHISLKHRVYNITPDPELWLLRVIEGIERILPEDSSKFYVFPNPTTDVLYVENFDLGLPYTIRLFNNNGALLFEKESAETFTAIPLSGYPKGIYQVVVNRESHKEVFKIAKQ